MSNDERKRGLRAAMDTTISPEGFISKLWEIIDSLVDEADDLRSDICAAAADNGLYDEEDPDSAITCIRVELDGYSKLMWKIQRICNADSALPDDVFAKVQDIWCALEELIKLQAHYAKLLNMHDGGQRIAFGSAGQWLARLAELAAANKDSRRENLHG